MDPRDDDLGEVVGLDPGVTRVLTAEGWEESIWRPTGLGRGTATYTISIEGRDEWLAASRRQA